MLWPIHLISKLKLKNYPACIPNWPTDQLRSIKIKINGKIGKSMEATKLLFHHLMLRYLPAITMKLIDLSHTMIIIVVLIFG